MPEMTTEQQTAQFKYRTNVDFHTIIDELILQSVDKDDANRRIKCHAACDLFVYGVAMVAKVDAINRQNMFPFHFAVDGEGIATYIGDYPDGYDGPDPLPIPAADFVLLTLADGLEMPTVVDGVVTGANPWVAAWRTVETDLDALLA